MRRRGLTWPKITRDLVLFTAGLAGMAHETLVANVERPYLVTAFLGMLGLPIFLRNDERKIPDKRKDDVT